MLKAIASALGELAIAYTSSGFAGRLQAQRNGAGKQTATYVCQKQTSKQPKPNRPKALSSQLLACSIIVVVSATNTSLAGTPGHWVSDANAQGNRLASLCAGLVKRMNSTAYECTRSALDTYPELSSPPWKTLDPKRHLNLIASLIAYGASPVPLLHNKRTMDPATLKRSVEAFIRAGGEIKVWRTHLINYYEPGRRVAPPGDQTVLLMIDKRYAPEKSEGRCRGGLAQGWSRYTFLVSPDLSGPDKRVDLSFAELLASSYPVILHHEQSVLVSYPVNLDYQVAYVRSTKPSGGFCSFKFIRRHGGK